MTLQVGYWRPSSTSIDVRQCPDAGFGCPGWAQTICTESTSGCRGGTGEFGDSASFCAPGLAGVLCQHCADDGSGLRRFYKTATRTSDAACVGCVEDGVVLRTFLLYMALLAGALILLAVAECAKSKNARLCKLLARVWKTSKPMSKVKILVRPWIELKHEPAIVANITTRSPV